MTFVTGFQISLILFGLCLLVFLSGSMQINRTKFRVSLVNISGIGMTVLAPVMMGCLAFLAHSKALGGEIAASILVGVIATAIRMIISIGQYEYEETSSKFDQVVVWHRIFATMSSGAIGFLFMCLFRFTYL